MPPHPNPPLWEREPQEQSENDILKNNAAINVEEKFEDDVED